MTDKTKPRTTVAQESREAETMRDFVEEIGTNGKPTGYFIFEPEAGQREGVA